MNIMRRVVLCGVIAMGFALSLRAENKQQKMFFEVLEPEELAIIAGAQGLDQDVIDLMHEHMFMALAAGRDRAVVVAEIKEVIDKVAARIEAKSSHKGFIFTVVSIAAVVGAVCFVRLMLSSSDATPRPPKEEQKLEEKPIVSHEQFLQTDPALVGLHQQEKESEELYVLQKPVTLHNPAKPVVVENLDLLNQAGYKLRPRKPAPGTHRNK